MQRTRIPVLGLYRSGSTAVAGALHHLGVDMGAPFFGGYYESKWLSEQLRKWWDEPNLREMVARPERVRVLARWIEERESAGALWVGMKHPLLSLCGEDLVQAWGKDARFIRCCRPLAESAESMRKGMGYKGDAEWLQGTLLRGLDDFFPHQPCLEIQFADLMKAPAREIDRLIEYCGLKPTPEQKAAALAFIEPGAHAKVEAELKKAKGQRPNRFLAAIKKVTG